MVTFARNKAQICMKKNIFFKVIFFLVFGPSLAWGQVGTVDIRLLMVLHPSLGAFDFTQQRLFRPSVGKQSLAVQIADARAKASPVVKKMQARVDRLARKRDDLLKRWQSTMRSLTKSQAKRVNEKSFRSGIIKEYQNRYERLLEVAETELREAKEEVATAKELEVAPLYLSKSESLAVLKKVQQEILSILAEVAREKSISVVFDPTLCRNMEAPALFPGIPSIPPHPDVNGPKRFRTFATYEHPRVQGTVPGPGGVPTPAAQHIALAQGQNMLLNFKNYLNYLFYLSVGRQATPDVASLVIFGGIDVTEPVARKLLERYRLDPNRQVLSLKLLQGYQQAERHNQLR